MIYDSCILTIIRDGWKEESLDSSSNFGKKFNQTHDVHYFYWSVKRKKFRMKYFNYDDNAMWLCWIGLSSD